MASSPTFRTAEVLPRLIRLHDALAYLGMDRNRFNQTVRPCLIEIPIGDQGIAFDRLDLDAWAEDYKSRNGRPAQKVLGVDTCQKPNKNAHRASSRGMGYGTSTSKSEAAAFAKALERATCGKPKDT